MGKKPLLLCVASRPPPWGAASSPWLWVVGLRGGWQGRCSLSAVLLLDCRPEAGTWAQGEQSAWAHRFFSHPFLLEPALPVLRVDQPVPSLPTAGQPSQGQSLRSFGNSHSNGIHKNLRALHHPQDLHPRTCKGNCVLHVFLAISNAHLYLHMHMAILCTHAAACTCKPQPDRPARGLCISSKAPLL